MDNKILSIRREYILPKIKNFMDKNVIKIITGQRRVGKSYALKQIMDLVKCPYIYINKELYEFDHIKNYHDLIKFVEDNKEAAKTALFIDEIQDIEGFENALRHFQAKECYDIYCTGSNANLLSGELATYLSGRYVQFSIHSLSFLEFKDFHNIGSINEYIKYGGMPYLKNLTLDSEVVYQYLQNVYESIILKDVVERYNLRNTKFLSNLVKYLCSNVGSITSANNITAFLKSQKINMSVTSVINYIDALKNCYFIYELPRFDILGKKLFEINHKYYFEDIGMRNAIIGYNQARDEGQLLENIVFMHLKRNGYNICIGTLRDKEIDFVATKNGETIYLQVALKIDTDETYNREFGNLLHIKDNYPKYVVTKESDSINTVQGVEHISIKNFLEKKL